MSSQRLYDTIREKLSALCREMSQERLDSDSLLDQFLTILTLTEGLYRIEHDVIVSFLRSQLNNPN